MTVVTDPKRSPITIDCGVIAEGKPASDPMAKETSLPELCL